jgi:MEMO1 family protein
LTPILVGSTSTRVEREYGAILARYLADPGTVFVVSSDFCHWGTRFRYTYYRPADGPATQLRSGDKISPSRPIHESIAEVDLESMNAVETGSHSKFWEQLDRTGNTVCGRHPIGVLLAAVEKLREQDDSLSPETGRFRFVRYERSEKCQTVRDSSVSYCSAFAVL